MCYLGKGRRMRRPIDVCVYLLFPVVVPVQLCGFDGLRDGVGPGHRLPQDHRLLRPGRVVGEARPVPRPTVSRLARTLCLRAVTILAVLDYRQVISIPTVLKKADRRKRPCRMYGPGIFQDPQRYLRPHRHFIDDSARQALRSPLGLAALADGCCPHGVLVYGFLESSLGRGGMLGLLGGLAIAVSRYG